MHARSYTSPLLNQLDSLNDDHAAVTLHSLRNKKQWRNMQRHTVKMLFCFCGADWLTPTLAALVCNKRFFVWETTSSSG